MIRIFFIVLAVLVSPISAYASEYCVQRYNDKITNVNAELGKLVKRQDDIDTRVAVIIDRLLSIATSIGDAADKDPPDTATIIKLRKELASLKAEKVKLEQEGFANQDRIVALKGVIPADLQGELRGCVEASAPTNKLVNLAIQSLAILSTGGASLALPPKSLYVDMSAVLNGYPTGGSHSVINEAREAALNALGVGGENNDIGDFIRDPGKTIVCGLFGC